MWYSGWWDDEDGRPLDIFRHGFKVGMGSTIKAWIEYWETHTEDKDRHQIALAMARFKSIQDEEYYYITLKKKNGLFVPNLEKTRKVREKNKKTDWRKSAWWYRRQRLKRLKQKQKEAEA